MIRLTDAKSWKNGVLGSSGGFRRGPSRRSKTKLQRLTIGIPGTAK